jgi:hypothetical protein
MMAPDSRWNVPIARFVSLRIDMRRIIARSKTRWSAWSLPLGLLLSKVPPPLKCKWVDC